MKDIKRWFIALSVIGILFLTSCENPFVEDDEEDSGTPPVVKDAGFVQDVDSNYEKVTSLTVGNAYRLGVMLTDPELDATTVQILEDGETTDLTLSSQTQVDMFYLTNPLTPESSDVGQYTAYLTPIDAAGNVGARFTLVYEIKN